MNDDFHKRVLFKIIDPVINLDPNLLEKKIVELRQGDRELQAIGEIVQKIVNLQRFTDLVFSDMPIEDWDKDISNGAN